MVIGRNLSLLGISWNTLFKGINLASKDFWSKWIVELFYISFKRSNLLVFLIHSSDMKSIVTPFLADRCSLMYNIYPVSNGYRLGFIKLVKSFSISILDKYQVFSNRIILLFLILWSINLIHLRNISLFRHLFWLDAL